MTRSLALALAALSVAAAPAAGRGHPEYPTGVTTPEETAAGDLVQVV